MKRWLYSICAYGACAAYLAGCVGFTSGSGDGAEKSQPGQSGPGNPSLAKAAGELPNLGAAPELENEIWLNTDEPLRLKDLRGKVVLLEMWTFF